MTNTKRMNKEQMTQFLNENFKKVTDESLKERIAYTAKAWKADAKQVTSLDLKQLVDEVKANLAPVAQPAVANSVKKTLKISKKQETVAEETAEEPKAVDKKSPAKKTAKSSEGAVKKSTEAKAFDLADAFKDEFTVSLGDTTGVMTKASDIQNFADLRKALENGDEIFFAVYWTQRLIRQFGYSDNIESIKSPKSFENDLDLVSCIFVGEEDTVVVGVSSYTERPYFFTPKDLKFIKEDGFRYVNNAEYEIYRLSTNE